MLKFGRPMSWHEAGAFAEPFFPHQLMIADHNRAGYSEVREWCRERFGECGSCRPQGYIPRSMTQTENYHGEYKVALGAEWCQIGEYFLFKEANAAFEFKMRWG